MIGILLYCIADDAAVGVQSKHLGVVACSGGVDHLDIGP